MLRRVALCLSLLTISACNGAEQGGAASRAAKSSAANAGAPHQPQPAHEAKPAGDTYANMPYAKARGALLAAGWLPLRTPECRTNVGGDAPVCNALPETDSCSGDGHCLMRFAKPGGAQRLTLHAFGDASKWNGPDADFMVLSSETRALPSAAPAACPGKDFKAFLHAYATSASVRSAFTAPVVKAAELHSDEQGDRVEPVAYASSDYNGFNLAYDGRAFHHIDAEGHTDSAPLPVQTTDAADGGTTVRYAYGSSEGRAYRFERSGDCWRLVEQLPPALD
ncbi:hypothetical protein [Cognatilysobacter lacus]|uniref:Secreted protein n=1 Tax=Cognatilysobacter lacus TaxID=1643323 RepID=A0A5D8YN32_9GAMM|nr:hypothetical protein [Lysobacter lacus]TZF81674.1 hypothetical protein FW784_13550 [Lysobacter lacus]